MGNKINEKKILSKKEFNIKFIGEIKKGENSYLIKLIKDSKKYFNIKIKSEKSNDIIIYKYDNHKFKLNLIDINKNKENNNCKTDCIIMEYDINDIKSFEEIKNLYNQKYKKSNTTNLFYLIGIKNNSEEKAKIEALYFSNMNHLKYFIISNENENEIKAFIKDLLENLEKETIKSKNNKEINSVKDKYKVCFIGSSGIGAKTSLINAIIGEPFNHNTMSTMNSSYAIKKIELENKKAIELELWDTIGQEKYRSLTKIFLANTDCFVLGFDITNKSSFDDVKDWYSLAKESVNAKLMYLIGNKIDLFDRQQVTEDEAKKLAVEYNLRYFETSCLTGSGIQEFVNDLANEIIRY